MVSRAGKAEFAPVRSLREVNRRHKNLGLALAAMIVQSEKSGTSLARLPRAASKAAGGRNQT